jgi:formylglycine-generating enzyme required for sulfatase activity
VEPIGEWVFPLGGVGIVIIDVEPEGLNAPWSIDGPCSYTESGNGDTTLSQLRPGDYTVSWEYVEGWLEPPMETQTLVTGEILTFNAVYVESTDPPEFVHIPPGTFTMGSPSNEPGRSTNETQHQVTLTHGIYVQTSEVTNQQYAELAQWAYNHGHCMATSASLYDALDGSTQELLDLDGDCEISFSGGMFTVEAGKENHSVLDVTWYGSVAYCDWLSLQQGLPRAYNHATGQCNGGNPYTAVGYRLPTEAEWEYACRSGSATAFTNGPITQLYCFPFDPNLNQMGWYCGNSGSWTHPVAEKLDNARGLYDMHGNLWEWCNDWNGTYTGTVTNPAGPASGFTRVLRGGSWIDHAQFCRSAARFSHYPNYSNYYIGFRSVRSSD